MLFLPEIKLQKICEAYLLYLKTDLQNALQNSEEEKSYLYLLFHEDSDDLESSTYYIQAKQLFLRGEADQQKIEVRSAFDRTRANLPTVHIMIPQDSESFVQLGDTEGGTYLATGLPKIERGFSCNFNIVCTSSNVMEVYLLSYTLRSIFLSSTDLLDFLGFTNPKFSLQDISIRPEILPTGVYVKGLMMEATYMEKVPQFGTNSIIESLYFVLEKINY